MKYTFAGLGASRAEVEELLQRDIPRNAFVTNIKKVKYTSADGRFSWDSENIYFDFYGQGKLRRITVPWSLIGFDPFGEQPATILAPSAANRWYATRTEFAGYAHQLRADGKPTAIWERAAWNTVNEWCQPHRYLSSRITIQALAEHSTRAWARLTLPAEVWYFVPHPAGHPIGSDNRFWAAHFNRHDRYFAEPEWVVLKNLTPEQREYLAVAWDAYEAAGKPDAPLHGLTARGPTPKQLQFAMKKLEAKVRRCNITPAMLRKGMKVELEHQDVTRGGIEKTARIAVAHLCERADYYTRLKRYVEK